MRILLLVPTCLLVSCAQILTDIGDDITTSVSHKAQMYRVFSGWHDTSENNGEVELSFHGRKSDTLESIVRDWHTYAASHCNSRRYQIVHSHLPSLARDLENDVIDGIWVYYAEDKKWPQANGTYKCK